VTKPSHQEIEMRAYFLWEQAGKPRGQSLHWWLVAEMELQHGWHKLPRFQSREQFILK